MDRLEELKQRFNQEPFVESLGAKLYALKDGVAAIELLATNKLVIVEGIVNGGFLAVAANSAGVYAAMSTMPEGHARLVSFTIQYMRPVVQGEIIYAHARVKRATRTKIFVEFEVCAGQGLGACTGFLSDSEARAFGICVYSKPTKD